MRRVTLIETSDGQRHESERQARAYCDNKAGEIIARHAHQLVHCDKYTQLLVHLASSLDDLATAHRWQLESQEVMEDGHD